MRKLQLNKAMWLAELRMVEAALRILKGNLRKIGYPTRDEYTELFRLKAKATRLYMLRRHCKGQIHAIRSCWRLNAAGRPNYMHWWAQTPKEIAWQVDRVLYGDPNYVASLTTRRVTTQGLQLAVVG